jgi:hypothetical protein
MAENDTPDAILACPNCGTRYRAPGPVFGRPDPTYRCARCQQVFSLGSTESIHKPPDLDFDLDEEPMLDDAPDPRVTASMDAPAFVCTSPEAGELPPELPPEPAFTASSPGSGTAGNSEMASRRTLSSLRLGVRFEVLLLVVFGAVGLYLAAYPLAALELVARLPFLGSTLGTSPKLRDQIYVADLRGEHEQLRGGRPAFVITGRVINDSNAPVGAIQVEGLLYGGTEEIAHKIVFAGVKASRHLVKEWTPVEIEMFEKITPPKSYSLAPGASEKFLIIFQGIPENAREFACRVVAAQPAAGG